MELLAWIIVLAGVIGGVGFIATWAILIWKLTEDL